jgi:hypothetical protein
MSMTSQVSEIQPKFIASSLLRLSTAKLQGVRLLAISRGPVMAPFSHSVDVAIRPAKV